MVTRRDRPESAARIVLGGGVSLLGEETFFAPVRRAVGEQVFVPFRGLAEIVPAQLGEEMVVHGALALARQTLSHQKTFEGTRHDG